MARFPNALTLLVLLLFAGAALPVAGASEADTKVFAIFARHCFDCHGAEKQKSGFRLDERAAALRGGDSGEPAIVPGQGHVGTLLARITTTNTDERMPPKGPALSSTEVAAVRAWIETGATWPAVGLANSSPGSKHWAFQPLARVEPPAVRSRAVRNPIDAFVLARLGKERLKPSPEANRATLIRRLHLDLLGLLPSSERVRAFTQDRRSDAYELLVDELLASPHFGERWARHWLDLARYADSTGYQIDRVRPGAYLYRDWVVDSFNRDQPFDQFTVEQLAGDLLPDATFEQKMATGFHRMTLENLEDGVDRREYECKTKVDRVATTGTAWLGLTVGCAECHTHKYDPITQREFYRLYAFFDRTVEQDVAVPEAALHERTRDAQKRWELRGAALAREREEYVQSGLAANQAVWERSAEAAALTNNIGEIVRTSAANRTPAQRRALAKHYQSIDPTLKQLAVRQKAHNAASPKRALPAALLLAPNTNAVRTHVHIRGDFLRPGEEVQPGVLTALNAFTPRGTGDRLDLARWIVSPENPLTARVAVNHIWMHLFGRGLVATPEDFGTRSEPPSHPELLDWLAGEFQRHGWSRKQLIRLIVTSATYRQSSALRPELLARDPQNVLLARQSRLRVEGEIVRDLFLSASGLLDPEIGGPSIYPPIPDDVKAAGYGVGGKWEETEAPAKWRRGLYVAVRRTVPYPVAMTLDGANPNECVARRERSNTPLQPLALLNNPVFAECADKLGGRIAAQPGSVRERIDWAFQLCLAREPSRAEQRRLVALWNDAREHAGASETQAWRLVAETLLNLDEFTTRE